MPAQTLSGKVALITASSRYTGSVIAATLARSGAKVAIHYHKSIEEAESLARNLREEGLEGRAFGADGRQPAQLREMAQEIKRAYGGVDILVNNLGPYCDTPLLQLPEDQWDWILDTNIKAAFVLVQEVAPDMIRRGWGRVINISAVSAFTRSHSVFGLAKAGLIHLTETLALELAPAVTVNAIAPGQIEDSELIDEIDSAYKRILRQETPLKRLVTRQEIAGMVVLLCTEPFNTVSGQTIRMDGGWSLPRWEYRIGAVEWEPAPDFSAGSNS